MSLYSEQLDQQQMELFTSADYYQEDTCLLDSIFEDSFDDFCQEPLENGSDWLDGFLSEQQNYLLSDCMMSSPQSAPCVQSEHSYSLATGGVQPQVDIKLEPDIEMESDALAVINPNLTMMASSLSVGDDCDITEIKPDLFVSDEECVSLVTHQQPTTVSTDANIVVSSLAETAPQPTFVVTCTRKLVQRQPTIIVTRAHHLLPYHSNSVLARLSPENAPNVMRGVMREQHGCTVDTTLQTSSQDCQQLNYDETRLPPTPPSSSYSDSEASRSPKTSPPSSPQQRSWGSRIQQNSTAELQTHSAAITASMPSSGILILTDEEKRTLIAEGYPVPTRLPLSKQEEKNLKKVQRKIKNKMSAQESRRKKKDYVETLEKKLEESNQENNQLKQKMETLESDNRTLLQRLQKLQSLANSLMPSSPLQSSTCLMVFALFFAVCFGAWSPSSLSFSTLSWPLVAQHPSLAPATQSSIDLIGTALPPGNDYHTPSVRARTLKMYEESDVTPADSPSVYQNALLGWLYGFCRPQHTVADILLPSSAVPENEADTVVIEDKDYQVTYYVNEDEFEKLAINDGQEEFGYPPGMGNTHEEGYDDDGKTLPNENITWAATEIVSAVNRSDIQVELNVTYTAADMISVLV